MIEHARSESEPALDYQKDPRQNDVVLSVPGSPAVVVVESVSEAEGDAEGYRESRVHAVFHGGHCQNAGQEQGSGEGIPDLSDLIIRPSPAGGREQHQQEYAGDGEFSEEHGVCAVVLIERSIPTFSRSWSPAWIDNGGEL